MINPVLVTKFGIRARLIDIDMRNKYLNDDNHSLTNEYMVIGSILQHANSHTQVWGSGLISEHSKLKESPRHIHAVRGPLTRAALKLQGIACPEIYGDPALLLPRFFPNEQKKRYKLGIIPHNDHAGFPFPPQLTENDDIKIISLRDGFKNVLETIQRCENIVSSSLHGLIVADAYNIPSRRLVFNGKLYGGDFKFSDYYRSIKMPDEIPVFIDSDSTIDSLVNACTLKDMNIDLELLEQVCPFRSEVHDQDSF
ncbi:polysaccharide pyruvyl transferase family protein [Gynuella sunshinyii]|uniref:polysaccharide pyruvyl transferase family protein n=1 Tax=Gynuella sunshinyii TaxID=1445505 RepID=UPI00147003E4|nr:polysaccharide pyruvyl transferase family protein [Gynuella sunshinyii]